MHCQQNVKILKIVTLPPTLPWNSDF